MLFNLGCYSLNQDEPLLYLISLKNHFPYKSRMAASASWLTRLLNSSRSFPAPRARLLFPSVFLFVLKLSLSLRVSRRAWSDGLLSEKQVLLPVSDFQSQGWVLPSVSFRCIWWKCSVVTRTCLQIRVSPVSGRVLAPGPVWTLCTLFISRLINQRLLCY